ncbi:MAG: hypothetical protein GXP55_01685, partial [Deltaproteobacteria bacterium]|nr:hypothetical protein [Deltaproteobacteria bacterium]
MSRRVEAGVSLRVALPSMDELRAENAPARPADELRLSAPEPAPRRSVRGAPLPPVSTGALSTLRVGLDTNLTALFGSLAPEHAVALHDRLEAVNKMAALLQKLASMDGEVA